MSAVEIKRKHLGEEAWRDILMRYEASGLGVTAFCRREGVGVGGLRLRQERFKSPPMRPVARRPTPSAVAPASEAAPTSTPRPQPPSTPKFIELGTLGQARVDTGRLEIKLDLGGGLSLHLVRG